MGNHDYEEQELAHGRIVPLNSEYGNTGFKFTVDKPYAGKEDERIRQLEQQCEVLAAEVDRMRPVVEATIKEVNRDDDRFSWYELKKAVNDYEASKSK